MFRYIVLKKVEVKFEKRVLKRNLDTYIELEKGIKCEKCLKECANLGIYKKNI